MVISWQLNKAEEKTKQHSNNKKLFPRKNVVYLLGCTSCPNGVILYIYIYLYIYKKNTHKSFKSTCCNKNLLKGREYRRTEWTPRIAARVKTVKEKRQRESGKVKMMKKRSKLMRKKVALTDTSQKKLLTQIFPQNITAGAWECHWQKLPQVSFLSRHKFCHCKHLLSWQKTFFCRDKHESFVMTKMILVAAPANDIGAACHSDWQWMQK